MPRANKILMSFLKKVVDFFDSTSVIPGPKLHRQIRLHEDDYATYQVYQEEPNQELIVYNNPSDDIFNSHSLSTYHRNIADSKRAKEMPKNQRNQKKDVRSRPSTGRQRSRAQPAPPRARQRKFAPPRPSRSSAPRAAISQSTQIQRYGAPVAMGSNQLMGVLTSRPFIIKKSELFTSLYCYTLNAFEKRSFSVNPGFGDIFPWLSNISDSWEFYRFRKVQFRYNPTVPTNTPGMVMMAFDSDNNDVAPISKQQFAQYTPNLMGVVWAPFGYSLPAKEILHQRNNGKLLCRSNATAGDVNNYDVGKLHLALQGCPVGSVGDVYVDYEVELHVPQNNDDAFVWHVNAVSSDVALPFSGTPTITGSSRISLSAQTSIVFSLPGSFLVAIFIDAQTNTDNLSLSVVNNDPAKATLTSIAVTSSAQCTVAAYYKYVIQYTDQDPCNLVVTATGALTSTFNTNVIITKCDPSIT